MSDVVFFHKLLLPHWKMQKLRMCKCFNIWDSNTKSLIKYNEHRRMFLGNNTSNILLHLFNFPPHFTSLISEESTRGTVMNFKWKLNELRHSLLLYRRRKLQGKQICSCSQTKWADVKVFWWAASGQQVNKAWLTNQWFSANRAAIQPASLNVANKSCSLNPFCVTVWAVSHSRGRKPPTTKS